VASKRIFEHKLVFCGPV